jgi:hypothetical protein
VKETWWGRVGAGGVAAWARRDGHAATKVHAIHTLRACLRLSIPALSHTVPDPESDRPPTRAAADDTAATRSAAAPAPARRRTRRHRRAGAGPTGRGELAAAGLQALRRRGSGWRVAAGSSGRA